MDMTIQEEIEQLVLRCIAADGLKACPKDISFLEKYRLKNLYFLSVRYRMEGTDCPELDRRAEGSDGTFIPRISRSFAGCMPGRERRR